MLSETRFRDLPVLLLYNLDPAWSASERNEVTTLSAQLAQALADEGHTAHPVPVEHSNLATILRPYDPAEHLVFNWCESYPGIPRSEPLVVRDLHEMGFVFTGATHDALALSQDKSTTKTTLARQAVPTPEGRIFTRPDVDGWTRYPAIVKTAYEHCSEGLTRDSVVTHEEELKNRISFVLNTFQQPALVEDFIDGREFHVTLIGNGHPDMLPVAEMDFSRFSDFHDHLCSYEAKFTPGSSHYEGIQTLLPAPLTTSSSTPSNRSAAPPTRPLDAATTAASTSASAMASTTSSTSIPIPTSAPMPAPPAPPRSPDTPMDKSAAASFSSPGNEAGVDEGPGFPTRSVPWRYPVPPSSRSALWRKGTIPRDHR